MNLKDEPEETNPLKEIILAEIRKKGLISFREYMEMALYYPDLGYYTSRGEKIGKKGDYYTSPYLTPVFGELIARQIEEMESLLGEKDFTIVEIGAGRGLLSRDILNSLKNASLHYAFVEPNPESKELLQEFSDRTTWYPSLEQLPSFEKACFLSNELFDAQPVHLVVMKDRLQEVYINEDFEEILKPAPKKLENYFKELGVSLPEGYRTEINLEAISLLGKISSHFSKGFVITIDYGYPSEELYQSYRSQGTLMGYHKHTATDNPYIRIGKQDITSHVNFSALVHWGRKYGLELTGFTDQAHFLLSLGLENKIGELQRKLDYTNYLKNILPIKNLFLGNMGETFKVLIQHKGIPRPELRGLRYKSRWDIH